MEKSNMSDDTFTKSECWTIFLEAWINKGNGEKPLDMFEKVCEEIKKDNRIEKFNGKSTWEILNQDDFKGDLEKIINFHKSFIIISYYNIKNDLNKVLDWIRIDEKTLKSKYSYVYYKINLDETPCIHIKY